ncbi:hypothetical protein LIER_34833 [Lithospermum erythrorhizon]|uniref:Protein kinase domain-containing protein n=1 Tax=Lithospermum erythrorhizon TaxID=34254 RepID=A0AAV3S3A7_LITER
MQLNQSGFFTGLLCFLTFMNSFTFSLNSDGLSLLALKAAITSDPKSVLSSWSDLDSTPCMWGGITCDHNKKVASISLSNKGFSGYIPSELGALSSLTVMNLSYNNFSKPIPVHLFNATSLLSLDLSNNAFYGPLPIQISNLKNLSYLDISKNQLNGSLPEGLSSLEHLVGTLNLSYNVFSGDIPESFGLFPVMVSLDLRNNNLTGKIPQVGSLLNQGPTAFSGNIYLCGFPLETSCSDDPEAAPDPKVLDRPHDHSGSSNVVVEKEKLKNGSMTIFLVSGVLVVIGILVVSMFVFKKKWKLDDEIMGKNILEKEVGVKIGEVFEGGESEEDQNGKFVVVDEGFVFELEDLLRASAYVVGKSRSGIVYKVVVGGGGKRSGGGDIATVAVRRLSEGDATWRFKEFVAEVEAIGKVNHPNVVRLKACYYASDEKLLVSEFIRNGSLYNALHGEHGSSLPPLTWSARLKIIQGTARGLTHIHECSPRKYVHGNIRSSKILLDDDLQPYISGFGLTRLMPGNSKPLNASSKKQNPNLVLVSPKASTTSSNMYMAPEARSIVSKLTQKCDVYSFGVVLLEILTGQMPDGDSDNDGKGLEGIIRKAFREERPLSEIIDPALLHEVQAKKQVVAAFHIALSCTELDPELRPRMKSVCESLDRINSP